MIGKHLNHTKLFCVSFFAKVIFRHPSLCTSKFFHQKFSEKNPPTFRPKLHSLQCHRRPRSRPGRCADGVADGDVPSSRQGREGIASQEGIGQRHLEFKGMGGDRP